MTVSMRATAEALESAMRSTGEFGAVVIGEPKNAPQNRTLAIWASESDTEVLNLSSPTERRTFTLRYYVRAFEDERAAELDALRMYDLIREVLGADLDLSTFGGAEAGVAETWPDGIRADWGYITVDQSVYRTVDIAVPFIVHDAVDYVR